MPNPASTNIRPWKKLYHQEKEKNIILEGKIQELEEKIKEWSHIVFKYQQFTPPENGVEIPRSTFVYRNYYYT